MATPTCGPGVSHKARTMPKSAAMRKTTAISMPIVKCRATAIGWAYMVIKELAAVFWRAANDLAGTRASLD